MNSAVKSFINIGLYIDRFIYIAIGKVYDLINQVANYQIFDADAISGFSRRVYILIGIFMLFKLTFSMISYLVNPDQFSDKTKGFSGLIKNIIISLALAVAVPYIFSEAYYVQRMILKDGTLVKIVFSNSNDDASSVNRSDIQFVTTSAGEEMQFTLFSQFVRPNRSIVQNSCNKIYEYNEDGSRVSQGDTGADDEELVNLVKVYKMNENCETALSSAFGSSNIQAFKYYKYAMEYEDFTLLAYHPEIYAVSAKVTKNGQDSNEYIIEYSWFVSTVVGFVVLMMLITICMDIAVRAIKLAFYQIIAPIPIIANAAPGSNKDNMLKKWAKACVGTYADLFIRLFLLYLGMYIIKLATNTMAFDGWVSIMIIIGVLIFVKQAPKIINDLTGLKLENFTINPFKKVANEALVPEFAKKPLSKISLAGAAGLAFGAGATLAKKSVAGIDSASHGKGFNNGFKSVHGKMGNSIIKARDAWLPYSAVSLKQQAEGREAVKQMHNKWTEGKKAANSVRDIAARAGKKDVFSIFDGVSDAAYNKVYHNRDFRESRKSLDFVGERQKALHRIDYALKTGGDLKSAINAELNGEAKGYLDEAKLRAIGEMNDKNAFAKLLDSTDKQVSGMEKNHESLRKQYQKDADTEDAIKHVKYNNTDPTDVKRTFDPKISDSGEEQPQQQPQEQPQQQQETNVADLHPQQDDSNQQNVGDSNNGSNPSNDITKIANEKAEELKNELERYNGRIDTEYYNQLGALITKIRDCKSIDEIQNKSTTFMNTLMYAKAKAGIYD